MHLLRPFGHVERVSVATLASASAFLVVVPVAGRLVALERYVCERTYFE